MVVRLQRDSQIGQMKERSTNSPTCDSCVDVVAYKTVNSMEQHVTENHSPSWFVCSKTSCYMTQTIKLLQSALGHDVCYHQYWCIPVIRNLLQAPNISAVRF